MVGTGQSVTNEGNILLYGFDHSLQNPFVYQQMIVARFAGGTVHGLDIFDYESDGDLDFVALVRFETGPHTDVWRYELFFCENIMGTHFAMTTIPDTLPDVQEVWYTGFADSTAADFDNDGDIDLVVHIGSTDPTVIYRFENTGFLPTPFVQLPFVSEDTEGWARHAKGMDSADFDGNGDADFATFDYPTAGNFNDAVVYHLGSGTASFTFPGTYYITNRTPHAINTITAGQFSEDSSPDVIVGGDDDGDPGQYWLYENRGDGYFSGSSVEVFDLNPDAEPPGQLDMPGAGVADAYDFDRDGMMDVVVTAHDTPTGFTSLYFVKRENARDFRYDNPQDFLDHPPVDTISASLYGNVATIAAPMITQFGRSVFIAHFMTSEGEPYPFDVIISNGNWRQEFKNVTYIETEVPETATYTYMYKWGTDPEQRKMWGRTDLTLSPSESAQFEFYAYDPHQLVAPMAYIIFQEIGAHPELSWEWNAATHTLDLSFSRMVNRYFAFGVPYVLEGGEVEPILSGSMDPDGTYVAICDWKCWDQHEWLSLRMPRPEQIESHGVMRFSKIDPDWRTVKIVHPLYNDAVIGVSFESEMWSLDGVKYPKFIDPQHAVPPGNYILQVNVPSTDYALLNLPIAMSTSEHIEIDFYPPKKDLIEPFTFSLAACSPSAEISISDSHEKDSKTLTATVSAEADHDWWGCFFLPDTLEVEKLTAYIGEEPIELKKWHDYTIYPINGHNLIVARIDPNVTSLSLEYEEKRFLTGIFSSFNLRYDTVELYIRVNKKAYSNKIYDIEILSDAQQPRWDDIEALEAPEGWNYEKIGNGLKFYTETNPLLLCQGMKFKFKVKAERISWYMWVHVTDQDNHNMGMIISTRWWLYNYYLV